MPRPRLSRSTIGPTLVALAILLAPCASAFAQQFSAELERRDAGGHVLTGKLAVDGDKIRIEQPNLPIGFFIIRKDSDAAYFVKPDHKVFMDAQQSSLLTELLVPVDPNAPCPQFQAMAVISGSAEAGAWRCARTGAEPIGDRAAVTYDLISPHGRHVVAWIDTQLRFVVRLASDNGATLSLVDIQEAPQPGTAFDIPASYPKFDPQQLLDAMRHSDSYVDPSLDSRAEPPKPSLGPDL